MHNTQTIAARGIVADLVADADASRCDALTVSRSAWEQILLYAPGAVTMRLNVGAGRSAPFIGRRPVHVAG
jgi:hypothetical protein